MHFRLPVPLCDELLRQVLVLGERLHENGSVYTFELPACSASWAEPNIVELARTQAECVNVKRCCFGMIGPCHVKKPLRFAGTLPGLFIASANSAGVRGHEAWQAQSVVVKSCPVTPSLDTVATRRTFAVSTLRCYLPSCRSTLATPRSSFLFLSRTPFACSFLFRYSARRHER